MKVISTADAATELGVSTARIRAMIQSGRLKATRIGLRSWAISMRDVDSVRNRKPGRPKGDR